MASRLALYGALLAIVHFAAACDAPQPDRQNEPETVSEVATPSSGPLIVAFGDSLFAGYQLDAGEGFVPTLEEALAERGIAAEVHNGAVSGDTSAGGQGRLAFMLDGLARKPDLVIVELGSNDMLRGLDPAKTRDNLSAILFDLKERDIDAMLVGALSSPNMGPEYMARFNAIYPELAEEYDVPLYPFVLKGVIGQPQLLLSDGVHPNAQGVDAMVQSMTDAIISSLPEPQGDSN